MKTSATFADAFRGNASGTLGEQELKNARIQQSWH
ncbi:hypothetical protein B6N60_01397 [Richelia sinica FACHB-800]|uniref:Uncharacterized protein n=2 Tax=Richelia TaxID=98443 RepID=A0A975Y417_9NOST|nr:hypothetical protein B6N60_01397 [Richelia sinica FACHB-800]